MNQLGRLKIFQNGQWRYAGYGPSGNPGPTGPTGSGGGGVSALSDLTDVQLDSGKPVDGDILIWDGVNSVWTSTGIRGKILVVDTILDLPAYSNIELESGQNSPYEGQLAYVRGSEGENIVQPNPIPQFESSSESDIRAGINSYTGLYFNPQPTRPTLSGSYLIAKEIENDSFEIIYSIIVATQEHDGIDGILIAKIVDQDEGDITYYMYVYEAFSADIFDLGVVDMAVGWNKITILGGTDQTFEAITYNDLPYETITWNLYDWSLTNLGGIGNILNTETYIRNSTAHTPTDFKLNTLYQQLFLNPEPRTLLEVNPDWNINVLFEVPFDKFTLSYNLGTKGSSWALYEGTVIESSTEPTLVVGGYWYNFATQKMYKGGELAWTEMGNTTFLDFDHTDAPTDANLDDLNYYYNSHKLWVVDAIDAIISPEVILIVMLDGSMYGYSFEDFSPLDINKGWFSLIMEGDLPVVTQIDYSDLPEISEATLNLINGWTAKTPFIYGGTQPVNPSNGLFWYDSTDHAQKLWIYYQSAWVELSAWTHGDEQPINPVEVEFWVNTVSEELYQYLTGNWVEMNETVVKQTTEPAISEGNYWYNNTESKVYKCISGVWVYQPDIEISDDLPSNPSIGDIYCNRLDPVTMYQFVSGNVLDLIHDEMAEYISDTEWLTTITANPQLYIYVDGVWKAISGSSGFTTVDTYAELPDGADGDLANVRMDTVDAKVKHHFALDEVCPIVYGNPNFRLSDLGTEGFQSYIFLGQEAQAMFNFYPDGEPEGTITIPYIEVNQAIIMDEYVIQNLWIYIEQDYRFSIDWQVIDFVKGWNYVTVKIRINEDQSIDVFDKNIVFSVPPILALVTFPSSYDYTNDMLATIFDEFPYVTHFSGMYERQLGEWVLINRSNIWNPDTDIPDFLPNYLLTAQGDNLLLPNSDYLTIN